MLGFLSAHLLTITAIAACIFAWWKGGSAERSSALLIGGAWTVSMIVFPLAVWTRSLFAPYIPFTTDGVVALGFLALALRYSSLWLVIAVFLQAGALALHAAFLTSDGSGLALYFSRVNLLSDALIMLLLAATINVWVRRGLLQRKAPPGDVVVSPTPGPTVSGGGVDGFPRKAFDTTSITAAHPLVRR